MEEKYSKPLNELQYANLPEHQEKKLRELERKFNYEFGEDYYFMVMKRDK
jgi:hypothetical protein